MKGKSIFVSFFVLASAAGLKTPYNRINRLYDAAVHTLVLLSAQDIYPGPFNYRRFWFRDACLMLNAMLAAGLPNALGTEKAGQIFYRTMTLHLQKESQFIDMRHGF